MQHRITPILLLAASVLLCACGGGGSSGAAADSGGASSPSTTALGTVIVVAAGANHSAVAMAPVGAASGPAALWGDNTWGQVGDGTLDTPKFTPVALKSSTLPVTTTWKAIAAGEAHTLAIRSDGTLWAWGRNDNGQLGDNNASGAAGRKTPFQIGAAKDWVAVAAGDAHSVALEGTGTSIQIMSWGRNASGQLGLGAPTSAATISNPLYVNVTDYAVPTKVPKAITVVSGANALSGIPFTGLPWKAITAGGSHTLALRSDGMMFSWGDNLYGQLGQVVAVNVSVPTQLSPPGSGTLGAIAIASGRFHSLGILTDHTLFAWGLNDAGQLGDTTTTSQPAPTQVPVNVNMSTTNDWFAVAAGGAHTLAIKQDQTLWAWGSNTYGQLGDGSTDSAMAGPIPISAGKRWLSVAAGRYHSMAIDTDGRLWVWGRNEQGQLGLGATAGPVLVPTLVP